MLYVVGSGVRERDICCEMLFIALFITWNAYGWKSYTRKFLLGFNTKNSHQHSTFSISFIRLWDLFKCARRVILQFSIFHCQNLFTTLSLTHTLPERIRIYMYSFIAIATSEYSSWTSVSLSLTSKKRKLHHHYCIILSRPCTTSSLYNMKYNMHIVLTTAADAAVVIPFTWMNMCIIMSVIYYAWTAIFYYSTD